MRNAMVVGLVVVCHVYWRRMYGSFYLPAIPGDGALPFLLCGPFMFAAVSLARHATLQSTAAAFYAQGKASVACLSTSIHA